jgi:hypothetical protein
VRDIALALLSSEIDPLERTSDEIAALVLALVVTPALLEASQGGPAPTYLSRLITRLQYALSVPEVVAAQGSTVRQAVSAAFQLRTGRASAARTLVSRLVRIQQWATEQGLRGFD